MNYSIKSKFKKINYKAAVVINGLLWPSGNEVSAIEIATEGWFIDCAPDVQPTVHL